MSVVIKLLENGETETPYKCMMKACKNPENKEKGLKCSLCRRVVHYSCANNKPDDPATVAEWFCTSECARKDENAKSKAQFDLLNTQHEATKVLLQALTDKFREKEREDSKRQAELSKCLDRIKVLEEENRRLSQQSKHSERANILLNAANTEGESSCSNPEITEKNALEIFNSNEDDEEFKRRLTAIFSMPACSRENNSGRARSQKTKEEIDCMSETEKLAYYQRLHVQRLEAPKLMRYSGDPAEWLSFKASYERMKDRGEYDNETMVDKLRDSLHGEAERYVKPRLNQPFADADSIMDALKKRFFQPKEAVAKAWEKLENWTQIPDKNKKSLEHFLVEIDSYIFLCKDLDFKPELEIAINSRITSKLPYGIESRWQSYVSDRNLRGNITEFSEFMWSFVPNLPSREITQAPTSAQSRMKASINVVQSEDRVHHFDGKKVFSNKKAKRDKSECWYCGNEKRHPLYRCDEFRKLGYDEKAKFLANNKICSKCLASNQHTSSTCSKAERIPKCVKKNCTEPKSHCTMMHPATCDGPRTSGQTASSNSAPLPQLHISNKGSMLFKVVPIYVIDGYGNKVETTLLMDRAAGASLVNMEFFKKLNISGEPYKLELSWLQPSSRHSNSDGILHDLLIAPINEPDKLIRLSGMTALDNVSLPYQEQHSERIKADYSYLRDAQIPSFMKQRPQILLGLPHAKWMISLQTLVDFAKESSPVAEKTPLGWTICGGTTPSKPIFHCCETDSQCAHTQEPEPAETLQELHELVRFYNSFESLGVKDPQVSHLCKEDQKAMDIKNRSLKLVDGRYEVGLYWRDEDCTLPNNYTTAEKRLRATEARLRQLGMVQWANDHIKSLIEQGFARKATEEDLNPAVPHKRVNYVIGFVTFNFNKTPPKPRWVVDTSCKHEGISLNSRLLKGPDNLMPLTQALFHFRERKVAVVSDVTQMYHQLVIKKEDQQVQRFLWRDCKSDAEPDIYLFTNMVFGLNCSPSQANSARIDHCENSEIEYPLASRIGLNSMYMDDAFNSEDTDHEAIHAAQQTIQMFDKISWKMVDFRSNSVEVLNSLPQEVVDKELLMDLSSEDELTSRKVLGLFWDPKKDIFRFKMTNNLDLVSLTIEHDYHPTKREVLSFIMKIFDCLGLIAHFTIRGRMILQAIWRRGIAWEQRIPDDLQEAWVKWLKKFDEIQRLEIPRHYGYISTKSSNISLHIFVDASLEAYSAVAYLRFVNDGQVKVALLMAKSRVAPVKYASVPKLELMAALIGARMMNVIKSQHKRIQIKTTTLWSDSITVLRWLYAPHLRLQQFVAPRVSEIQEISNINDWRYIASEENVADDGTKWNDIDFSSQSHRWINGPKFLYEDEHTWSEKFPSNVNIEQLNVLVLDTAKRQDDEQRSLYYGGIFEKICAKIRATWIVYVTVVAWVLRFKNNLIRAVKGMPRNKDEILQVQELDLSEKLIFSQIQRAVFKEELKCLRSGWSIPQSSKLYALNPFLDVDGLIRAKTRMYKEDIIPYDMKCPVILPNKHETIHAFLVYLHIKNKHIGVEATVAETRSKVWIIHARKAVKRVIHQCLFCIEMRTTVCMPPAGPLPSCRLDKGSKPFEHCGLDCAGSFTVYAGNSRVKKDVYIVIFTCMTTRAIYLRKLDSLTADEMLLAIQDVWTRRGPIRHLYSDNGRNFLGASNIIKAEHHKQLAEERKITWHFNPPLTPHWGGVWERLIRDIKRALKAEMHNKIIREKVFECALLQIEDIMNSRPLTHLPVSPDDLVPLTPNYLVKLHPGYTFVSDNVVTVDGDINHMTIRAKKVSDKLTTRWMKEYLPVVTKSYIKGHPKRGNLELGDYVIYADPTVKPAEWKRGLIVNVYTGRDGHVRVADIKLQNGDILERRSSVRLAKLEIDNKSFATDGVVLHTATEGSETSQHEVKCEDTLQTQKYQNKPEFPLNKIIAEVMDEEQKKINQNRLAKLVNELGEAEFIKKTDMKDRNTKFAKNLRNLAWQNKFEDRKNERTARIHKIPSNCCLLKLITALTGQGIKVARVIVDSLAQKHGYFANITCENVADYEKLIKMKKIKLMDIDCDISPTTYPKRTFDFKGFEFTSINWSFGEETAQDTILLGRLADKQHKVCAVPVMSNRWFNKYREYRQQLDALIDDLNPEQQNAKTVVENNNKPANNAGGRLSPQPSTSGQAQAAQHKKLKSIIVVPSNTATSGDKKKEKPRHVYWKRN